MIRIETTAEFDAEGRFVGQAQVSVTPGIHRVTVVVSDVETEPDSEGLIAQETVEPHLEEIDGILVWTGPVPEGIDTAAREILEERAERFLRGPFE